MQHPEAAKQAGDIISAGLVVSTLAAWLPPAAALVSLIWGIGRLIEMWTGKTIAQLRKEWRDK